jgi:ethanolaminephosphotransferase
MSAGSLITLRVIRRWNQTGQKFAGEPDIAKSFFPSHRLILWGAVLTTYFVVGQRISRRGFRYASAEISSIVAISLCLAAFSFKVSFTNADAPELLEGFSWSLLKGLEGVPLVTQARTVFWGIGIVVTYVLFIESKFGPAKEKDGRQFSLFRFRIHHSF